ncbi:hypothetical protein NE857_18775 [Nocardiopsis exhalans]|uniref:Uncharacterized protein n=1 Tax=Nocardiopsis exhalans TaxID=163604 RepID=A0ABY5D3G3_9ACTN|nr:hypothetical protein [Nocardiopsis exhalans]USY17390.1 hypothetical protein NE857_18775 [Nocardiopsis exhalans]
MYPTNTALDLVLTGLPLLVGAVGLCLVGRFPRPRGAAITGLILILLGPLSDVFLFGVLSGPLFSAGLYDVVFFLGYVGTALTATGLLLLALAATRGPRKTVREHRPPQPHPGYPGRPGPPGYPGQHSGQGYPAGHHPHQRGPRGGTH